MFLTGIDVTGEIPDPLKFEHDALLRENGKDVALVAGRGVANELKAHFLALNASRHGGFSTVGYYERAADEVFGGSTGAPANEYPDAIGVGSTQVGLLLRRFGTAILPGGFLRPKEVAYLAIPNYDFLGVIHGRSPREFTNLRVVFGHQKDNGGQIGPIGLAADEGGARNAEGEKVKLKFSRKLSGDERKAKRQALKDEGKTVKPGLEGNVLFWLKKQVFQAEDETVLPGDEQLLRAGVTPVIAYLEGLPPPTKSAKGFV